MSRSGSPEGSKATAVAALVPRGSVEAARRQGFSQRGQPQPRLTESWQDRIINAQLCTYIQHDDSVLPRFCGSPAFAKSAKVFLATCERIGILQSGAAMRQPRTFSRQKKLTENGLKCAIGRAIRLLAALSMVWAESPKPVQEFVSLGPRRFAPDEWSHYLRITRRPALPPDTQSPSPSPSSAVRRPSFCRAPAGTS